MTPSVTIPNPSLGWTSLPLCTSLPPPLTTVPSEYGLKITQSSGETLCVHKSLYYYKCMHIYSIIMFTCDLCSYAKHQSIVFWEKNERFLFLIKFPLNYEEFVRFKCIIYKLSHKLHLSIHNKWYSLFNNFTLFYYVWNFIQLHV